MHKEKVKGKKLYIIVLILVALFASIGTILAERMIVSNAVSYSNGSSELSSIDVQGALDELYTKYKCGGFLSFVIHLKSMSAS